MSSRRRSSLSSSLCFTLDVLTDGSEFTGHGTIFLSVWRRSRLQTLPQAQQRSATAESSAVVEDENVTTTTDKDKETPVNHPTSSTSSWLLEVMNTTAPLARYAISGLGDGTARLCADQRVKLAPTRAVFLPCSTTTTSATTIPLDKSDNCDTRTTTTGGGACWDGLPALLLALHTAGAPSLHIVAPSTTTTTKTGNASEKEDSTSSLLEDLSSLVLGRRKDLEIRTCHVPSPLSVAFSPPTTTTREAKETATRWWRVYEDEYLIVHATRDHTFSSSKNGNDNIVFLYSLIHHDPNIGSARKIYFYTIALLPPHGRNVAETFHSLTDLPILDQDHGKKVDKPAVALTIDCILALDASTTFATTNRKTSTLPLGHSPGLTHNKLPPILVTLPNHADTSYSEASGNARKWDTKNGTTKGLQPAQAQMDPGILIRSQQITKAFHSVMPWAFPSGGSAIPNTSSVVATTCTHNGHTGRILTCESGDDATTTLGDTLDSPALAGWQRLRSCSSVLLEFAPPTSLDDSDSDDDDSEDDDDDEKQDSDIHEEERVRLVMIDRSRDIWERSKSQDWSNTLESLQKLVPPPSPPPHVPLETDENEIELEDEEDEDNNGQAPVDDSTIKLLLDEWEFRPPLTRKIEEPHMLVLGTGCASPSALRGASGYALVFPKKTDALHNGSHTISHHSQNGRLRADQGTAQNLNHVVLLDCGEGVTTMLSRHGGGVGRDGCGDSSSMDQIVGIWISHAHLDHYGGLPTLIRALHGQRSRKRQLQKHRQTTSRRGDGPFADCAQHPPPSKQARLREWDNESSVSPPWVMAPRKVLSFLDLLLGCQSGKRRGTNDEWFIPVAHHQYSPRGGGGGGGSGGGNSIALPPPSLLQCPGPNWTWFQNIPVLHSCGASYGLLLGWNIPHHRSKTMPGQRWRGKAYGTTATTTTTQWFCFSGDTRPCRGLVQAFQHAIAVNAMSLTQHCVAIGSRPHDYRQQQHHHHDELFLMHEATFQDEDQAAAVQKKHSTVSEALMVAKDVTHACRRHCSTITPRVLLTHFSQRYSDIVLPGEETLDQPDCSDQSSMATTTTMAVTVPEAEGATTTVAMKMAARVTAPTMTVGLAMDGLWLTLSGT
jgi:ribonuclease BN (tRNA processing enzyme)